MDCLAIIFDKDGTLFDFEATWGAWAGRVLAELAQRSGVSAQRLGAQIGYEFRADGTAGFARSSLVIAGTLAEVVAALMPALPMLGAQEVSDFLDAEAMRAPLVPVLPLGRLLDALAPRHLAVMTNDSEGSARAHLRAQGVEDRFSRIIGFDSGFGAKPSPEPLRAALGGIDPARALMVGDSRHDLAAGRALGAKTVGVLTGPARAEDLADLADVILPSIAALPDWLAGRK